MNKILTYIMLLIFALPTMAQRRTEYVPKDGGFWCINGTNRYTRALYGGPSAYRLETSDRPVFAVFADSKNCRNISFSVECSGERVKMDSTDICEALYNNGVRTYTLSHKAWGNERLRVEAICLHERDAAVFIISREHPTNQTMKVQGMATGIRASKLSRNGDLGADPSDSFESNGTITDITAWQALDDESIYFVIDGLHLYSANQTTNTKVSDKVEAAPAEELSKAETISMVANTRKHNDALANLISFQTPDPYINTLGSALVFAADGAWNGETWQHGAIGWRTPLAGWRGGYLGDVIGWNDRAKRHFDAYAASQVTGVEPTIAHPTQSEKDHLARAEKTWGTQMYSNGYICRKPGKSDIMHHYDMNLNYIDELLWHFMYDADTTYMRRMWPVITSHLAWEKRNYDPDGDHLYDAYCCIWASDALYYSGGAVTHSSAYNYRANLITARIAELLGEDPEPYKAEAEAIRDAMNERLWVANGQQHWAEYQDLMGLQRVHPDAAVWSEYTAVDCGVCTPEQARSAMRYISESIPHINVNDTLQTISTSNWMPYAWSINNVAAAEVMHTTLAYFEAGLKTEGFNLLKANVMDQMYLGQSPGNFGQISQHDAARGECYRDFTDNTGISARALIQGLFGIVPDALNGRCYIRPGFPEEWDSVTVKTPYLSYTYRKGAERYEDRFIIEQNFAQPLDIIIEHIHEAGTSPNTHNNINTNMLKALCEVNDETATGGKQHQICVPFNASVSDIFSNRYVSPRPPYTTLQIPVQGVGEWCHPDYCPEINDSVFRSCISNDIVTICGTRFRSPHEGPNVAFTSLWDNYPDSISIDIKGKGSKLRLLMAGSTNHMQTRMENALITITYKDGTQQEMPLIPPYNWAPIEQDYYIDGKAFNIGNQHPPVRVCLGIEANGNPLAGSDIGEEIGITGVYGREIPGGAAQLLTLPLRKGKPLKSITLRTLSNDVVIGIMAATVIE